MDIHIPVLINLQLQELAKQQERGIGDIIMTAIAQYVEQNTNETAFRECVRHAIDDHRWLLTELDKR
jgi:predicted transcriptional regulator